MECECIKILLVDDDEDDYVITRDLLSEVREMRYELQWVSAYDLALEVIEKGNHDVYLFDYKLGSRNGLDLLREAIGNGCKAPVILMTVQGYLFSPPMPPEDIANLLEKEQEGQRICLR